ncbi:unnamed protein product [Bursaphelenchus okinawaensis]|uniref:Activin_recp domain-containing protein n=1 Tax=Bursaphelenchus okinawaensis TaxID=465554 RepID=A0A811K066_9BILA|nr:unnamed protein product [Bursaphelenchus okinawaensis]CAG9088702.1 unnamed protein product [Bursaphelenchus okinawaensis]
MIALSLLSSCLPIKCLGGNQFHGKQAVSKVKCPKKVEYCLKYSDQKHVDWFLMCDYGEFCSNKTKQLPQFTYICCNMDYCNNSSSTLYYSLAFLLLPLIQILVF